MAEPRQDLTRTTLAVLFIGGLIAASFWVLRPFLLASVWAMTLVIATWPLMQRVQHALGNRRGPAVVVMTFALLLILIIPFWLAISTIIGNLDEIRELIRTVLTLRVPAAPPAWLSGLPLVGAEATSMWGQLTSADVSDVASKLTPYAGSLTAWFASAAGDLSGMFVQFLLTVAIAAIMYSGGEHAAAMVVGFGQRLGGDRGEAAVRLAGLAIRSVALGVVVTALAQSVLGGIGLAVVGVPFAALLTATMFVLCLAQIGPGPVLIPAIAWMYYANSALWATVLVMISVVAMLIDNWLRPALIRRGGDLPMLLVFAGVIGGLSAMGLLGIFIGPTVLVVGYTLLNAWMLQTREAEQ